MTSEGLLYSGLATQYVRDVLTKKNCCSFGFFPIEGPPPHTHTLYEIGAVNFFQEIVPDETTRL